MDKLNMLTKTPEDVGERLDILKENNNLLEDYSLIENCLNKNVFMRNLNKSSK